MKRTFLLALVTVLFACDRPEIHDFISEDMDTHSSDHKNDGVVVNEIGAFISESDASEWISRYRKNNPDQNYGILYGKDMIKTMMEDDRTEGFWFMYGDKGDGKTMMVIYASDKDHKIIRNLSISGGRAGNEELGAGDQGFPCPPFCP